MNLIIDVGNSRVKIAVFYNSTITYYEEVLLINLDAALFKIFTKNSKITHAMLSSVGKLTEKQLKTVASYCRVYVVGPDIKIPFENKYQTPNTLGADRIALATAAYFLYPNQNALLIDAGTCVTFDLITDKAAYLGGAISLGLKTRYKALHDYTAKLPLLSPKHPKNYIGNTSEESIHSGVVNGMCVEIDGVISQYKADFENLTVILTGGDAHFLSIRLKNSIFANDKFLLEGLNYLLEYNKQ